MPANTPRGYTYPLYADAVDFPAQIQDFAQDVDLDVQALTVATAGALDAPSGHVSATANQLIVASTDTFLTFANEDYDNAAMVNLGVNNDRITFTSTGLYLIHAECNWTANGDAAAGGRKITIWTNTGNEVAWDSRRGASNQVTESSLTYLYQATAVGSYVRFRVTHTSGSSVNINLRSMSATKVAS